MFKQGMFQGTLNSFPQQKAQNESLFETGVSLEETFYRLQDNTVKITDHILANFVTKYFVGYLYPETIDQSLQLSDIEDIMTIRDNCHTHKTKTKRLSNNNPDTNNLIDTMIQHSYGLAMLTDIAPTIALIKDITMKTIDKKVFNDHYIGLDLGTGTGILLAAQYIQAIRNNFNKIDNIGLEINTETQKRSNGIAAILNFGIIKRADITNIDTYQDLNINSTITYISNETISSQGVSMNKDHDPFYPSLKALYTILSQHINNDTQIFPEKIQVTMSLDNENNPIIGDHSNMFQYNHLKELELQLRHRGILKGDTSILNYTYPEKISIDGVLTELHLVGNNFREKSLFNLQNRRRSNFKNIANLTSTVQKAMINRGSSINDLAFDYPATIS